MNVAASTITAAAGAGMPPGRRAINAAITNSTRRAAIIAAVGHDPAAPAPGP